MYKVKVLFRLSREHKFSFKELKLKNNYINHCKLHVKSYPEYSFIECKKVENEQKANEVGESLKNALFFYSIKTKRFIDLNSIPVKIFEEGQNYFEISGSLKFVIEHNQDDEHFKKSIELGLDLITKTKQDYLKPVILFNDYLKLNENKFKIFIIIMIFESMWVRYKKAIPEAESCFRKETSLKDQGNTFINLIDLEENNYLGYKTNKFFDDLYKLRSNIIHWDKIEANTLTKNHDLKEIVNGAEKFITDCLKIYIDRLKERYTVK